VASWFVLSRHGVGTFGTAALCLGLCATVEGVVSVLWCRSDVPCRTGSYGWHGVLILVV
jgi:hypothetical protein